jgi:hypothetical protein
MAKDIGADSTEAFGHSNSWHHVLLEFQDTKQKLQRETVITG